MTAGLFAQVWSLLAYPPRCVLRYAACLGRGDLQGLDRDPERDAGYTGGVLKTHTPGIMLRAEWLPYVTWGALREEDAPNEAIR